MVESRSRDHMLTTDWLQDGISAVAERDGFIAVADTGGRVTFFSEDLQVNDGQIFCVKYFYVQRLKWVQNFSLGRVMSLSFHVEYDSFVKQVSCDWWRPGHVTSA